MALHTLEICTGVGMLGEGLRAGLQYMGVETRPVCYIEREAHASSVLATCIEEGSLDAAPVWSDLCTFDAGAWRGAVDCIVAGFPCQDISLAGRRAGLDGARSGLFFNILDIADACGAQFLFLENVAGIASATATVMDEAEGELFERAAARVVGELADRGWDAEWITLSASDVGASHGRARWFCWAWRRMDNPGCVQRSTGHEQDRPGIAEAGRYEAHHGFADRSSDVARAERAERWPECVGSVGSVEGNDTRGRQAHGGPGIADTVLGNAASTRCEECGQCGQRELSAQAGAGLHDRPEQSGAQLADTTGNGWHEGRAESVREQGRPDAAECGGAVECEFCGYEFPEHLGRYGCPNYEGEGLDAMSNPGSKGQQGRELGTTRAGNWGGAQAHGPASQLCGLFAPGPSDPRWAGIIASQPWLAPAIDKETESLLRGTPDGLARRLDFDNRAARLRCVGNGVVALCASTALVVLLRRAGFMTQKQPLAPVNKAQEAIEKIAEKVAA